jgi:type I restriction enzyme R subunit
MPISPAGEDALAEQPALAWLCGDGEAIPGIGWTHVHGGTLAPDLAPAERALQSDVVLAGRLYEAVARLNPHLPQDAVQRVCEIAMTGTSPVVIEDHRAFHELLLAGVAVSYRGADGLERHDHARLVDFDAPARNEFLAVNQLTIVVGSKNRRPDILLYVNGLALGQIELKAPGAKEPAKDAVNQVAHYTQTIPGLYRYVEIVGVSDLITARVGTITTPHEHFSEWKTMSAEETERSRAQLELMIDGVFAPARFLDLIRDFVLFETDGARTWKVMAKYHQVHAVEAAVESVARAMAGDQRGGPTRWSSS